MGRVACGYVADFPQVDSLLLNNVCLLISTIAVAATPLCYSYESYIVMSIFFGIAICKALCYVIEKCHTIERCTFIFICYMNLYFFSRIHLTYIDYPGRSPRFGQAYECLWSFNFI